MSRKDIEYLYEKGKEELVEIIIALREEKEQVENTLHFSTWALTKLRRQLDKNKDEISSIIEVIISNDGGKYLTYGDINNKNKEEKN